MHLSTPHRRIGAVALIALFAFLLPFVLAHARANAAADSWEHTAGNSYQTTTDIGDPCPNSSGFIAVSCAYSGGFPQYHDWTLGAAANLSNFDVELFISEIDPASDGSAAYVGGVQCNGFCAASANEESNGDYFDSSIVSVNQPANVIVGGGWEGVQQSMTLWGWSGNNGSVPFPPSVISSRTAAREFAAQNRSFSALSDRRASVDPALVRTALRSSAPLSSLPVKYGAQPELTRPVFSSRRISTGVFPTSRGLCFVAVVRGVETTECRTTAEARRSGLGVIVPDGRREAVLGVLPRAAQRAALLTAAGAPISHSIGTLGGYEFTTDHMPTGLAITSAHGNRLKLHFGRMHARPRLASTS